MHTNTETNKDTSTHACVKKQISKHKQTDAQRNKHGNTDKHPLFLRKKKIDSHLYKNTFKVLTHYSKEMCMLL